MSANKSISESEWQVMKVIWRESPITLQEVLARLEHTGWSTTTIQTYLSRLVKKGALATQREGRGYLYSPSLSETDCQAAESKTFLDRVYSGSLTQMFSSIVKNNDLTIEELAVLKQMIEERELENADTR